jgi:excisionase family DNA binding protein
MRASTAATADGLPAGTAPPFPNRGLSVREVAKYLRISPDRVRAMIARGELQALDMGTPQRPRLVVLPEFLAAFGRRHRATTPQPAPRRRRAVVAVDYYPD